MIYRGLVTAVDARGVYVRVAALGASAFGPIRWVGAGEPAPGDGVLVADCGDAVFPDLVVIGVVA